MQQSLSFVTYCISFLLLLAGVSVDAQSLYKIDSLKQGLAMAKGKEKVDMLLHLSQELWSIDTTQANNYAREAYQISEAIQYPKGLVWGIAYQGVPLEYYGSPEKAQVFYRKGLEIAQRYNFEEGIGESFGNIAIAYQAMNERDSAIYYYHKAINTLRKTSNLFMLSEQLSNLGMTYNREARYDSALHYMTQAKEASIQLGDSSSVAGCYQTLGRIETRLGRIGNAFEYYLSALRIYQNLKNDGRIASTYDMLASLYGNQGEYQKSVEHYEKAFQIRERIGDKVNIPLSLNNVGQAYLSIEKYDEAITYLEKGYEESKRANRKSLAATFLHNLAYAQSMRKQYREALKLYRTSLDISEDLGDRHSLANTYMSMGNTFLNLSQREGNENLNDSAIVYYQEGLRIAQETGTKNQIKSGASFLGYLYKKNKEYEKATEMLLLEAEMSDSLENQAQREMAANLDAKYQMRQNTIEMEALRKEQMLNAKQIQQQKILNFALAAILLLVLALTVVLYRNNKRTKIVNAELARQRAEIQQQNEEIMIQQEAIAKQNEALALKNENLKMLDDEKNYLIGVVAHDLKSPINQLKGLLGIIMLDAGKLSDDSKKILELANQVLSNTSEMIAKILDLKAIEAQSLNLKMELYDPKPQLLSIVDSFQGVASKKHIKLQLDISEEDLTWELDRNLFEQVMENLVSNAIKFSPTKKEVSISAKLVEGMLEFAVSDQGPGLHPEEMSKLFKKYQRLSAKPTAGESSTGLGLSIVKKYVMAMRGEVWCESTWGKGASFIMQFKPTTTQASLPV